MLQDALALFENGVAITATRVSTNIMDCQAIDNTLTDLGTKRDASVVINVTESFATATSVAFSLESDSTANLATSPTVHATTGAIVIASLTAGTQIEIAIPQSVTYERYLGLRITVAGSNATAGLVTAAVVSRDGLRVYKAYADRSSF